ncbi:plasmid recombination protein [Marinomonas communis]|uniref:plasmid recombination protein n=1 Tax=Marinomonas communis TaxID=28254 RepID=UPI001D180042|nr:plasmid recombination protein [Marinomonas communis]MCC4276134.1 plasmid recombination protein [Marinomonas communis]
MSGKNYCANNTQYYKDSNDGDISHILRKMQENINSVEPLQKNNFGFCFSSENEDLNEYYERRLAEAKKDNPLAIQKNSNTFIDSVLIFSSEHFLKCIENGDKQAILEATKDYMTGFKKEFGFEPIGFEFHLDEGDLIDADRYFDLTPEQQKKYRAVEPEKGDLETEYIKHNIHAHAVFLNYDFDKKKSCLRDMRKDDWSKSQDLLASHFNKFGFERGEKKLTNKKDHKTKEDYVRELSLKTTELLKEQSKYLDEKNEMLDTIIKHQERLSRFENLSIYVDKIKDFFDARPKLIQQLSKAFGDKFEKVKGMALEVYEALKDDDGIDDLELALEDALEQKQPEPEPQAAIKKDDELKEENKQKEKEAEEKKKRIEESNKKRRNARKYKNRPRPE